MTINDIPPGFQDLLSFGFIDALLGRRSRRFFMGAEIPDGVFAYKSKHKHMPLSEIETLLVATACGGNTGWHNMIYRAQMYAPRLSNYAASAGGRTFPSAAGFHTSKTFFTDDSGVYVLEARDSAPFAERELNGTLDLKEVLETLRSLVRKIKEGRLAIPRRGALHGGPQHMGGESSRDLAGDSSGRSGPARPAQSLLYVTERPDSNR